MTRQRDKAQPPAPERRLADDLRGASRLAIAAVTGIADTVEAVHQNVAAVALPLGQGKGSRTRGITGLVYGSVRGITRLVGAGVDSVLGVAAPWLGATPEHPSALAAQAALNGVYGDYLAASGNPLAFRMRLHHQGQALQPDTGPLRVAEPSPHLLILLHGLCMNDLQWRREGHDHGAALAADHGMSALYLRYNSGRRVGENGRELAVLLERLIAAWPVPVASVSLLGHSMGGLVARSAIDAAQSADARWPARLRSLICLGTPHLGATLERAGHHAERLLSLSPYSAPLARLGGRRSAGIRDLRQGQLRLGELDQHVPWPQAVACHAIAATRSKSTARPLGDGLVSVDSALGRHADPQRALPLPQERQHLLTDCDHFKLLNDPRAYAILTRAIGEALHG